MKSCSELCQKVVDLILEKKDVSNDSGGAYYNSTDGYYDAHGDYYYHEKTNYKIKILVDPFGVDVYNKNTSLFCFYRYKNNPGCRFKLGNVEYLSGINTKDEECYGKVQDGCLTKINNDEFFEAGEIFIKELN